MTIGRRDSAMRRGPTGIGEEGWTCLESQKVGLDYDKFGRHPCPMNFVFQ